MNSSHLEDCGAKDRFEIAGCHCIAVLSSQIQMLKCEVERLKQAVPYGGPADRIPGYSQMRRMAEDMFESRGRLDSLWVHTRATGTILCAVLDRLEGRD